MIRCFTLTCAVLIALPLSSAAARADTLCQFETECYETESCAETNLSLSFVNGPNGPDHIQLVTDSETLDAFAMGSEALGHIAAISESAFHLISITPLGQARYSIHVQGPSAITYHGSCEAK